MTPEQEEHLDHLYNLAAEVLGSVDEARLWMSTSKLALGDQTPIDATRTARGARTVEEILLRLKYGVYG